MRLALAQHAAWLRVRLRLRELLIQAEVPRHPAGQVLKAFDGLPFNDTRAALGSDWLPSDLSLLASRLHEADLNERPLLSALTETLHAESAALLALKQAVSEGGGCTADSEFEVEEPGEGLQYLVWRGGDDAAASRSHQQAEPRLASQNDAFERPSGAFELRESRLNWLRWQHAQVETGSAGPLTTGTDTMEPTFRQRLFQLLARYDAMGGGTHGAGNQAAVPPEVFEAFEAWARVPRGSCVECFASPLNHRMTGGVAAHSGGSGPNAPKKKQKMKKAAGRTPSPVSLLAPG